MDRRQLLAGGAAIASLLPVAQVARAQDAAQPAAGTIEEAKVPALEGGMFLMQSSQLAQVGSSRVDLQACKLEYSIVSPK